MAKLTLDDTASGYNAASKINANNDLIEAALENTISRDGTSPNTMQTNLDMNNNRVANVSDASNIQDAVTLSQLNAYAASALGTGSAESTSYNPANATYVSSVTVDGALDEVSDSSNIGYKQGGTGYVERTVESRLREVTSVTDFLPAGYVTDGSVDYTTQVQAALDSLSEGEALKFPKATYQFSLVSIVDKGGITLDFQGSTIVATSGTPDHLIRIENTTPTFRVGLKIQDVTLAGTCAAGIKIVGGAWSNMQFDRIFSTALVATYMIYYYNQDATVRNPSNFSFNTIWNQSAAVKYLFYYYGNTGSAVDNFSFDHILHWSNQVTPSAIKFFGAGCQYSSFNQVYGALWAENAAVIATDGAAATITRSEVKHVLMEGSQDNRETLAGNFLECRISNIVNYYDDSQWVTNYALNGKVQNCDVFMCLLQGSMGGYSELPSVVLDSNSKSNVLTECHVITDGGSITSKVVEGLFDKAYATLQRQSYTTVGVKDLASLLVADFRAGDLITVDITGYSTGSVNKTVQLYETGIGPLGTISAVIVNGAWSGRLTYVVYDNAGTLSVYRQGYGTKGTAITLHAVPTSRTFEATITPSIFLSGGVASGETIEVLSCSVTVLRSA